MKNWEAIKERIARCESEREIADFNKQFDITPILLVNVILKF